MLIVILFFWLVILPFPADAQEGDLSQAATPSATLTPPAPIDTQSPGPSATPTNAPALPTSSSGTTPSPTVKKTSSQSNGLGGSGLVEDKDNESGLDYDKDNVLGSSAPQIESSEGDRDLLVTLIFLTGAVVLVVWTVYMILVQKGVIKSGVKKDKHRGGITPQPLE